MLPSNIMNYRLKSIFNRNTNEFNLMHKELLEIGYSESSIKNMVITVNDYEIALKKMNVSKNSAFYHYNICNFDEPLNLDNESLFSLDEIYENYKNPFWENEYPNITERYLQLSSIEGEYSYFYDKKTDALYGVDWAEMDDFIAGKLKPLFTTFYDFLEWYYEEEIEIIIDKTISLKQLSNIIPWAGLKTIEDYNKKLIQLCKEKKEYEEYLYLFEDFKRSANDLKLKEIILANNLVYEILDTLGMVIFYTKNSNTLSSLTYEDEDDTIVHQEEWSKTIRDKGWGKILQNSNDHVEILKASDALITYGYEIIEKVYERTRVRL